MNRVDLQQLAELRLREAEALLSAGCWDGAYYLCGYAVECGLKACIAKKTREHDFPDLELVRSSYTHKFQDLVTVAGLEKDWKQRQDQNPKFRAYWNTIKDWRETGRYQRHDEPQARALIEAVSDPQEGVLSWLKGRW